MALDEEELLDRCRSKSSGGLCQRQPATAVDAGGVNSLGSAKGLSESVLETDDGFELVLNEAIQISPDQFP